MKPAAGPGDARALLALSAGAVLIGLAPIFVRLSDVGPVACGFWRAALAWPVLAIAAWRAPAASPRGASLGGLVAAGVFFGADLAFWHISIGHTSVANATLLANVAPVFVAAAAWLLFRERISAGFLAGLVLAMTGAAILVGHSASLSRDSALGDAQAIVAAMFYAGYLMTVARLRRDHATSTVMAWTSLVVAASLLAVAVAMGERIWPASLHGWLVLAGLALLSHVGGQGLIAYSLASLPASFSAVGLLLQPVAAALFAWALLGERFGWQQALGGVVVLAGITVCRMAGDRK